MRLALRFARRAFSNARLVNVCRPVVERLEDRTLLDGGYFTVDPAVNISRAPLNQNEATIVVDPTNPEQLFAASNTDGADAMFARYSTDGGQTWLPSNVTGIPASCCDNQAAADEFGNLFVTYLSWPGFQTIVAWSTNFGQSFAGFHVAVPGSTDQPSISVGGGEKPGEFTVWVSVQRGGGIVAAGARVTGLGQLGTFSAAQMAPDSGTGGTHSFGGTAVGPNGEVMVTYHGPVREPFQGPSFIYVNFDPDGLGPAPFGPRILATRSNVGTWDNIPAQNNRTVDAEPNLAWDRSGGPYHGRVYLVYSDEFPDESNNTDTMVRYSDDNGTTWSKAVRVNDDATTNSQFNPAIAVDQTTGNVAVSWYDARNVVLNNAAEVWATVSLNGGETWLENVKISLGVTNCMTGGGMNCADYDTMDFHGGYFYRVWADNSPELPGNLDRPRQEIATARVRVGNPAGPVILGQSVRGTVEPGLQSLQVTFNTPVDPKTFTPEDVILNGPGGAIKVLAVTAVDGSKNMRFDIHFATLGQTGQYTLAIGPNIIDLATGNPMDQDGDGTPGEKEDAYQGRFNISGLWVTGHSPRGESFDPANRVRVTFNRPMDPKTFTPDDVVSFIGPKGAIPVTSVTPVKGSGDLEFDLEFDLQATPGTYTLVFGPDVRDLFGNPMDQNNNLTPGEIPGDRYTATFQIADVCPGYEGFGYFTCAVKGGGESIVGMPGTFTVLGLGRDLAGPVNLGSNRFSYYGTTYTGNNRMFLSNKGLITFVVANTVYTNTDLSSIPIQRAIAVLWDDWIKPTGGPSVLGRFVDTDEDGIDDWLVLEWNQVVHFPSSPSGVTFQAVLQLNTDGPGEIYFNYLDLITGNPAFDNGASATVGIKDANPVGDNRLLVTFNQAGSPYLGDGKGLWFSHSGFGPLPGGDGQTPLDRRALESPAAPVPVREWDEFAARLFPLPVPEAERRDAFMLLAISDDPEGAQPVMTRRDAIWDAMLGVIDLERMGLR